MLSYPEYRHVLKNDFMSFTERSFYDLNPQARFIPSPHIETIADRLDACRLGLLPRSGLVQDYFRALTYWSWRSDGRRRASRKRSGYAPLSSHGLWRRVLRTLRIINSSLRTT